jgi:hypothetical protein
MTITLIKFAADIASLNNPQTDCVVWYRPTCDITRGNAEISIPGCRIRYEKEWSFDLLSN